ncbi:gp53-like domain-containing protein [Pseudogemmobacter blasticus]|uniref:Putative tail fiber protein gp53-like C-terminal domain-containing protein n=1 Tax=Fuscovulum blasticum DSM 2131 TaxID=1188250 RepID=A0A2T4JDB6_FUSBL|nr:hypothetical protein [Fuscovulum blasticum]PTE15914.1 hypothetical protein C5F44_02425 [Fuscovulum blasticum DSM 2131]
MANLDDTTVDWPEGVYLIERLDPVVGGVPNEATMAGVSNIPHLHLARRTRWLKTKVDQLISAVAAIGAATTEAPGIVRLVNALNSTAADRALTAAQGKVLQDSKAPLQSPVFTGAPTAPRPDDTDYSDRIVTTGWAKSILTARTEFWASFGFSGYQRLPSGLIMQWGRVTVPASMGVTWTFPIAFPNACLGVWVSSLTPNAEDCYVTGMTTTYADVDNHPGQQSNVGQMLAIGW